MSASGIRAAFLYPFPQGALRKLAQAKGYGSGDIAAHWRTRLWITSARKRGRETPQPEDSQG